MRIGNQFVLPVILLLASFVAGCTSVPMTSVDQDEKAKSFVVRPDKSSIYVYRNEFLGGANPMTVTLNGKVAGRTVMWTYLLLEVDPGSYEVGSIAENITAVKLNTEAGKAYFLWQEVRMGAFIAGSQLQQVDEQTGRKGVAECKRTESNF